jgi:hypothetical protein
MNQFKPIFLGTVGATEAFAKMKRAVDTQKVATFLPATRTITWIQTDYILVYQSRWKAQCKARWLLVRDKLLIELATGS